MTLPRFHRLCRYWASHPPIHVLLGAIVGIGKAQPRADELGDLIAMFKHTGGVIGA